MKVIEISQENRCKVNDFINFKNISTEVVKRGVNYDITKMDGFILYNQTSTIGLVTYKIVDNECEIISLDSIKENQGYGTMLVNKVIEAATEKKCNKVKLIITNENINAFAFYQKRGFDIVEIHCNVIQNSISLKDKIPIFGDNNIPIKHEIEFEMIL